MAMDIYVFCQQFCFKVKHASKPTLCVKASYASVAVRSSKTSSRSEFRVLQRGSSSRAPGIKSRRLPGLSAKANLRPGGGLSPFSAPATGHPGGNGIRKKICVCENQFENEPEPTWLRLATKTMHSDNTIHRFSGCVSVRLCVPMGCLLACVGMRMRLVCCNFVFLWRSDPASIMQSCHTASAQVMQSCYTAYAQVLWGCCAICFTHGSVSVVVAGCCP